MFEKYFDWKKGQESLENTFINQIFEGDMLCSLECKKCGKISHYFEKFGDLTVDLTNTKSTQELYRKKQLAYQSSRVG